jgi:hypothetical protein
VSSHIFLGTDLQYILINMYLITPDMSTFPVHSLISNIIIHLIIIRSDNFIPKLQAEYKSKSRKDYKLVALQMLDQGVKVLNKELNVSFMIIIAIIVYYSMLSHPDFFRNSASFHVFQKYSFFCSTFYHILMKQ